MLRGLPSSALGSALGSTKHLMSIKRALMPVQALPVGLQPHAARGAGWSAFG